MRFAREIIDLLGAMPEREFRMGEILNHISGTTPIAPGAEKAARKAAERAIEALVVNGSVIVVRPFTNQRSWAYYRWAGKCDMRGRTNATEFATFRAGDHVC